LRGENQKTRSLQERTTFQSFFDIDYLTDGTTPLNLTLIAQSLATAYNDLVRDGYDDPFDRQMDKVEILEVSDISQEDAQGRPVSDLNAFLMVIGTCTGCPADSMFTADTRRRKLKSSKKSKSGKGHESEDHGKSLKSKSAKSKGGKGDSDKEHRSYDQQDEYKENSYHSSGHSYDYDKNSDKADTPSLGKDFVESSGDNHYSHDDIDDTNLPMLPTENELRLAYAKELQRVKSGILDVVSLDEVEAMKDSPPTLGYAKYPYENLADGGKGGKGRSKGQRGSKKSSKKTGKGQSHCPELDTIGSYTGTFTSYFSSIYELLRDTDEGLEVSAAALTTAYNRVIAKYAADITMKYSTLYDPYTGRTLSFEEADLRRKLQVQRQTFLRVVGQCSRCNRQFTFSNQIRSNMRDLSVSEDCLLPGLPTAEEVRIEYNVVLDELDPPNVQQCLSLEEIDKPEISVGKGDYGGKGGTDSSDGSTGKRSKQSKRGNSKKSGKGNKSGKGGKGGKRERRQR